MQDLISPHDSALTNLYAYERNLAELAATLRDVLGFVLYAQYDPGKRVVTYGYHWHRPDGTGMCSSHVVVGYPTLMTAIVAGLLGGGAAGLIDETAVRAVAGAGERWKCDAAW